VRPFGNVTRADVLREAHAVDKLSKHGTCEHLVRVIKHAWLPESPYYYIDMELCEFSLDQYILSKSPLTYDLSDNSRRLGLVFKERGIWSVWDIMEQISEGMRYIHASEQVHRDLKPRNGELPFELELIVVLYSGTVDTWKIADFGLTAEGTSKQARTTRYSMGTPCYRAPELMREHPVSVMGSEHAEMSVRGDFRAPRTPSEPAGLPVTGTWAAPG
jgi:serine/threonine protein kinase